MYSSLDTETTGTELIRLRHKPFFVSCCDEEGILTTWQAPVNPITREPLWDLTQIEDIQEYIDCYSVVCQNGKFDKRALENIGITIEKYDDTLIASHILDNLESHDLKELAVRYLDLYDDDEIALKKTIQEALSLYRQLRKAGEIKEDWGVDTKIHGPAAWHAWLPKALLTWILRNYPREATVDYEHWEDTLSAYGGLDSSRTIQLWLGFVLEMRKQGLWKQYQMEIKTAPAVYEMETRGITLRTKELKSEHARYTKMCADTETQIKKLTAKSYWINKTYSDKLLRSPKQLQTLLYKDWGLHPMYRTKTGYSTDASTLIELSNQLEKRKQYRKSRSRAVEGLELLIQHRSADTARKYLTNYKGLMKDGRLHPSYNQTGTKTTRFSHSNPNNANVGKGEDQVDEEGNKVREFKLRSVFGPSSGRVWFPIDYRQLQLLIFAYLCNDESMKQSFRKGYDFHKFVASRIFDVDVKDVTDLQKRIGKNVNFGFIFGASPEKIEATAGIPGLWDTVTSLFPQAHEYMREVISYVRQHGYVYTPAGRKLWIPRGREYIGTNYIIQGCEGEIVKKAMRDCHSYLEDWNRISLENDAPELQAWMTMQVHDEIVFDLPDFEDFHQPLVTDLVAFMEKAGRICTPQIPTKVNVTYVPYGKSWADATEFKIGA